MLGSLLFVEIIKPIKKKFGSIVLVYNLLLFKLWNYLIMNLLDGLLLWIFIYILSV